MATVERNSRHYGRPPSSTVKIEHFEAMPSTSNASAVVIERFEHVRIDAGEATIGGSGMVVLAYDAEGTKIALKRLILPDRHTEQSPEEHERICVRKRAAFRSEFILLSRLSAFKQFPTAYGFGEVDGAPVILMEWIEGVSLEELLQAEAKPESCKHLNPNEIALVGKSLFDVLSIMERFGEGFVHRDLSPANIILRTSENDLGTQFHNHELDVCLIDFGSSVIGLPAAMGEVNASALRGTTPEYAPPELLTDNLPDIEDLRNSPKVDVYAACSVLYELHRGSTPFRIYARSDTDAAQLKIDEAPIIITEPTANTADLLDSLLCRGLAASQDCRPWASVMHEAFSRWFEIKDFCNLPDDAECFSKPVSPLLLLPSQDSTQAIELDGFNASIKDHLEQLTEIDSPQDDVPGKGFRGKFEWWRDHNLNLYLTIVLIFLAAACVYMGHAYHEAALHWGWC